jgi:hypothetical protein
MEIIIITLSIIGMAVWGFLFAKLEQKIAKLEAKSHEVVPIVKYCLKKMIEDHIEQENYEGAQYYTSILNDLENENQ